MNFEATKLPKKISTCPIAEAIIEIRFDSNLLVEEIISIVFNKVQEEYPKIEKLPILELPSLIRENDPNLKFAPQYRLSNDNFTIQIGPRCFSLICPKEYKGWMMYYNEIQKIFKKISHLNFIEKPLRVGVRYINFFEDINIFENLRLEFSLAENSLVENQNTVRSSFKMGELGCIIQLSNESTLNEKIKGSTIDVDVINNDPKEIANFEKIINDAHDLEKRIFFGIIKDSFLRKFNPEY